MRNRFPGTCYRCGETVAAGAGHFEKVQGTPKSWRVQHAECAIKYRGSDYSYDEHPLKESARRGFADQDC